MGGVVQGVANAVSSVLGGDAPQAQPAAEAPTAPVPVVTKPATATAKPKESAPSSPRVRGGRQATILTTDIEDPKLGG